MYSIRATGRGNHFRQPRITLICRDKLKTLISTRIKCTLAKQSVSSLCLLISNESNSDEVHCKFLDAIMHKQQQQQQIDFLIFDYSFWKNVVSLILVIAHQERLNLKKCANDDDDDKSNEINNNVTVYFGFHCYLDSYIHLFLTLGIALR
ncbi:conserved hypothetical protein [Trichinella spiralis]|uniref:hypothetical protein n=1 Tax=Trichinella spiralis TaxID=6334 RepID=UPI0001EFB5DA|nr:conserved hypothetical protein [Trichinella spiralis]